MIQIQPGRMWPDEEAEIKDDHPKFGQHALSDREAAMNIVNRYSAQRVRAQKKQLKDNEQHDCAGNKRDLFFEPSKAQPLKKIPFI